MGHYRDQRSILPESEKLTMTTRGDLARQTEIDSQTSTRSGVAIFTLQRFKQADESLAGAGCLLINSESASGFIAKWAFLFMVCSPKRMSHADLRIALFPRIADNANLVICNDRPDQQTTKW
jgi:hypothetical protein